MADTLAHLKREGLYHLGIQKTPSRNALSHQNAMRDAIVLRDIFRLLHKRLGQQSFTCQFRGWRESVCVGWVCWGGTSRLHASCCSIRALSRSASIYSTGHITAKIQNLSAFASLKKIFGTHMLKFGFCHL